MSRDAAAIDEKNIIFYHDRYIYIFRWSSSFEESLIFISFFFFVARVGVDRRALLIKQIFDRF